MQVQILTGLLVAFSTAAAPAQSADFPVTEFGAVAEDAVPDTAAIQAAIDACGAADGGRVLFPRGTCLSGTIRLRSGVEMHFPEGARLKGVKDLDAYAGFLAAEGTPKLPQSRWHRGLLVGENLRDVAFTGQGVIDGNQVFDPQGEEKMRGPHTILLGHCRADAAPASGPERHVIASTAHGTARRWASDRTPCSRPPTAVRRSAFWATIERHPGARRACV